MLKNTNKKRTRLNINTQPTSCTLRTEILRTGIVFSLVLVTNLGFAQCTVFDLSREDQNKIVKTATDLIACKAQRTVDSTQIIKLDLVNVDLQRDNTALKAENVDLKATIDKKKKLPWIAALGGLAVGIYTGSRIR